MFRFLLALLATLSVAGPGLAQVQLNYLAVNGELLDEAGPYYFVGDGEGGTAFARTAPFARALGITASFDAPTRTLVLEGRGQLVRLKTTADVRDGLAGRPDGLTVNGEERTSPLAILVNGVSYLPIGAVGTAFGWEVAWNAGPRVITLEPVPALPEEGTAQSAPGPAPPPDLSVSRRPVVVVDAGHGGRFPGARGFVDEGEVALAVALLLRERLEERGVDVVLTRATDAELASDYRRDLAARAEEADPSRNLFVSIHANASDSAAASGVETWVVGRPLDPGLLARAVRENGGGEEGQALTQEVLDSSSSIAASVLAESQLTYSLALARSVQERLVAVTGAPNRGVRQNAFFVLRAARIPAILVEVGFVTHPDEGRELATGEYQGELADALAAGVLDFLSQVRASQRD